jgi:hypothetical protein
MKKSLKFGMFFIPLFLFFVACKKDESKKGIQQTNEKILSIHCSPYRNVTGYFSLCSELNSITNCMIMECTGNSVTTSLTNSLVVNPSTSSYFIFASNQVITPAEQNNLMLAAKNWANVNKPSGYYVYKIIYSPNIIVSNTPPVTYAGIQIVVTYKKCTGSTPPPNN